MSSDEKQQANLIQDRISQVLSIDTADDKQVASLVNELTGVNNIETKTDLSPNQIIAISKAIWFARRYNIEPLDLYVRKVMLKILVSKNRGGRHDIIEALVGVFRFGLEKAKAESVKV